MNYENEIWKDCKGYEGLYQVSNLGRVRSLERIRTNKNGDMWVQSERIIYDRLNQKRERIVSLNTKSGNRKVEKIYRLVAIAFIPNPQHKKRVIHLNDNLRDDRVENLKWN